MERNHPLPLQKWSNNNSFRSAAAIFIMTSWKSIQSRVNKSCFQLEAPKTTSQKIGSKGDEFFSLSRLLPLLLLLPPRALFLHVNERTTRSKSRWRHYHNHSSGKMMMMMTTTMLVMIKKKISLYVFLHRVCPLLFQPGALFTFWFPHVWRLCSNF